ncbi:hypothetical protein AFCDBAGC_4693 [Methylobacterium cerastii]|uniref:Uncharacterized protein n=1 Tax=Methylobacterium cerastii TaxID=932741 RepID=A0ABQ4QP30_9HYPH|nr:hypothetical protein [Methylobacterium cerastii]GJD46809.1 hypothetical protein AFCDBAGC_4693 [Methylobacterium cerastii]
MSETAHTERLMRRVEAASFIRETFGVSCCASTLAKLAVVGGGPEYQKFGRFPLYTPSACRAWVQGRLSRRVTSTSELSSHAA